MLLPNFLDFINVGFNNAHKSSEDMFRNAAIVIA